MFILYIESIHSHLKWTITVQTLIIFRMIIFIKAAKCCLDG